MENLNNQDRARFASWPSENPEFKWSTIPAKMEKWWDILPKHLREPNPEVYKDENYVVLDFETTNEYKGNPVIFSNKLCYAGWMRRSDVQPKCHEYTDTFGENESGLQTSGRESPKGDNSESRFRSSHIKQGGIFEQELLLTHIDESSFLVAHNAKFELGWLSRMGYDIASKPVWCTQVAEYVIAGNRNWGLSFDKCAERRGFTTKSKLMSALWSSGVSTEDLPRNWVVPYLKNDVHVTYKIFLSQLEYICNYAPELLAVVFSRCLYTPVLSDVEFNGMHCDSTRVNSLFDKFNAVHIELSRQFESKYGGYNWNSVIDKDKLLYKILKFKIPKKGKNELLLKKEDKEIPGRLLGQANEEALSLLKATTKEQKEFLSLFREVRKYESWLSKYLRKLKIIVDKHEGVLKAQLNQTITQTHRLSSHGLWEDAKIQLQNPDRRFKPVFTSRFKGGHIGEADASQLEWCTAMELTKDLEGLNSIYIDKEDRHAFTAEYLFGSKFTSASGSAWKSMRTDAKSRTFKPLFGGEYGTKREMAYFAALRERFGTFSAAQDEWENRVAKDKKITLPLGLTFYFDNARRGFDGKLNVRRNVFNYPIQSIATADCVPIASIYLWHVMRALEMNSVLVNFVHDSAIADLFPGEEELWMEIAQVCFTNVIYWYLKKVYDYTWVIPLESEVEIKTHWATSKEWEEEWLK